MHLPRRTRLLFGYLSADLTYVMFMKRFPKPTPEPDGLRTVYFAGATTANWLCWQVPAVLGIVLADVIPTHWGLGFAGVLALLGLTYSLVSDRTTALAVVVAGGAAVAAFALPLRLNIVVAIAAAVSAGLVFERAERRAVRRAAR